MAGKTHLAVAFAVEAIRAGHGAYFITAHDLITDLGRAARENRLDRRLRVYVAPKVLVIDEMDYLPLDALGATIFFQLVSARYERGSIILTSNKSYGEWGSVFGDPIIATAIFDRLLHHATAVNIRGESYRLKERWKAGLLTAPGPTPERGKGNGLEDTLPGGRGYSRLAKWGELLRRPGEDHSDVDKSEVRSQRTSLFPGVSERSLLHYATP